MSRPGAFPPKRLYSSYFYRLERIKTGAKVRPSNHFDCGYAKNVMKRKPNLWLFFCIGLSVLILLSLTLTPVVIRYILKQRLGPEKYAELRSFFDDPVSVPEEWREPNDFPADLVEAASRDIELRNNWKRLPEYIREPLMSVYSNESDMTPEIIEQIEPYYPELEARLVSLWKVVSHPEYDLSIWDSFGFTTTNAWVGVSANFRYAGVYAQAAAASGDFERAFDLILPTFRFPQGEPPLSLISRMLGIVSLGIGVGGANEIWPDCSDERLLDQFLQDLSQINRSDEVHEGMQQHFENSIAVLRAEGSPKTKRILAREEPKAFFCRWATDIEWDSKPPNPYFSEPWYYRAMRKPPVSNFLRVMAIDELLWSNYLESFGGSDGVRDDFIVAKARFDILRLNLANRILGLRGRETASRASELVPEFFKEELAHPGTGDPYEWDAEAGEFVFETEE